MTRLFAPAFAVALLVASGSAFASSCPSDMKAIDAALASNPKLTAAEMTRVKELRAEGEALHKAGKHAESVKTLHEAKEILDIDG